MILPARSQRKMPVYGLAWRFSVLLTAVLLIGGCQSLFPPPVHVDLSTPKSAALAYLKAVQAGDDRTARAACFGTPEELKWVDGRVTLVDGMRKFDNALWKYFGNVTSQIHVDLHDTLSKLADVWIVSIDKGKVASDENIARIDPDREGFVTRGVRPIALKHFKEGWKVDVAKTYADEVTADERAALSANAEQWRIFGQNFAATANDVLAKRFHTQEEAAESLYKRLQALRDSN